MLRAIWQRWTSTAEPPLLGPGITLFALLVSLLALFTDIGPYEPQALGGAPSPIAGVAVGVFIGAVLLMTLDLLLPGVLAAALALAPVGVLTYLGRDTIVPVMPMVVLWWIGYTRSRREGLLVLALALLSIAPPFINWRGSPDNLISWSIGLLVSWLASTAFAGQRRTMAALRAAQADLAHQAATDERRRIAREIHDVVAHTLAITMLHLTGARHILQRDPQRAAQALAQAEALGRQSLADLRRSVGLLADGRTDGRASAMPGAEDIPALLDEFVRAGMRVSRQVEGDPDSVPAALGLDLYRIVQEATANAARHAPESAVAVMLQIGDEAIQLQVENAPLPAEAHPAGDGRGISGMRERAALHSGELWAGRDGDRWLVRARLPFKHASRELR
jgi:signal transduction histidine kinase